MASGGRYAGENHRAASAGGPMAVKTTSVRRRQRMSSHPNSSEHELLKTGGKLMNAAEVVVLDNYSASDYLNAEWIASTVPADDENSRHRPTSRRAKFGAKLC